MVKLALASAALIANTKAVQSFASEDSEGDFVERTKSSFHQSQTKAAGPAPLATPGYPTMAYAPVYPMSSMSYAPGYNMAPQMNAVPPQMYMGCAPMMNTNMGMELPSVCHDEEDKCDVKLERDNQGNVKRVRSWTDKDGKLTKQECIYAVGAQCEENEIVSSLGRSIRTTEYVRPDCVVETLECIQRDPNQKDASDSNSRTWNRLFNGCWVQEGCDREVTTVDPLNDIIKKSATALHVDPLTGRLISAKWIDQDGKHELKTRLHTSKAIFGNMVFDNLNETTDITSKKSETKLLNRTPCQSSCMQFSTNQFVPQQGPMPSQYAAPQGFMPPQYAFQPSYGYTMMGQQQATGYFPSQQVNRF